ncbi:hypothetical protein [Streptomyces sp. LN704]|uniref:hypothetical protein n=1 Tax=unclassified Streptomyces TaxID=2593676 RepID=UPI0037211B82
MITPQLHTEDFSQTDIDEFRELVTELLVTCRSIADEHAPEGVWKPHASDLFHQFGESMALIADVSRALNSSRGGIRRISGRARQRLYDRTAGPSVTPRLD